MLSAIAAAAVLGVVSAPHCLAMCGPLAVAGCTTSGKPKQQIVGYLSARSVAYATVGAVMGHLGASALAGSWTSLGSWAMAGLAITCVWQGLRAMRKRSVAPDRPVSLGKAPRPRGLLESLVSLLPKRGAALGALTAILPCGALVGAWGIAAASAHPVRGAAAMFVFAGASSPGLLIALLGRRLGARILARVPHQLQAAAWFAVAALLVGRLYLFITAGPACHQ
jgi:uncharacterized protein